MLNRNLKHMPATPMTQEEMRAQCDLVSSCPEVTEAEEIQFFETNKTRYMSEPKQEKKPETQAAETSECPICGMDIDMLFEACSECGINPYSDG